MNRSRAHCLLHPQRRAGDKGSGTQGASSLCSVPCSGTRPSLWFPPKAGMVGPPCRDMGTFQSLPGPGGLQKSGFRSCPSCHCEATAAKQEAVGSRGQRGQVTLSSRGVRGQRKARHVIPACSSQGKDGLQAREAGPQELGHGGWEEVLADTPIHGSSPGPPDRLQKDPTPVPSPGRK